MFKDIFKGQGDKVTLGYFWKIQFSDFQPIFMPSSVPWVRNNERTRTRQSHNFYTDVPTICNRLIYITHQSIIYVYSLFTTLPSILNSRKKNELYLSYFTELLCTNCILVSVQYLNISQRILKQTKIRNKRNSSMIVRR